MRFALKMEIGKQEEIKQQTTSESIAMMDCLMEIINHNGARKLVQNVRVRLAKYLLARFYIRHR